MKPELQQGAYMFLRALSAFLVLPCMVGGVFPALIFAFDPWRRGGFLSGYLVIGLGLFLLLWCVRDFYISGKGTLAPWNPPRKLVIVGLYQFHRNPMYIGVLLILTGWCMASGSIIMIVYTVCIATLFHLRVIRNEEPWLEEEFGEDWLAYSEAVNRWVPRLTPWYPQQK